jgi:cytochrome c oxidase subunit III
VALAPVYPLRRRQLVSSGVLGMLIFIMTEVMMFMGFISGFTILKANAPLGWPPPDQPRLPLEETAFNTLALLASGLVLFFAGREFPRDRARARRLLAVAIALGGFFVGFQGFEWVALLRQGLTLTATPYGSFFYLIVGAHALHAVVALGLLAYLWAQLPQPELTKPRLHAIHAFWYFVVGIWPVLYLQVYL